jgi:hypothetical protein
VSVEFWEDPGNADDLVRRLSSLDDVRSVASRLRS